MRVFYGAADDEHESANEPQDDVDGSGSEATEDWEDGTTLFSRFMETDSPLVTHGDHMCSPNRRAGRTQIL